jgi:hypothetical protein
MLQTGIMQQSYRKISAAEMTVVCLNLQHRKFVTGDHLGNIKMFHYANGQLLNTFAPHCGEVTATPA